MRLRELIAGLDAELAPSDAGDVRICDLTEDSRTVMPGSLFIARRGERSDGRAFIPQAAGLGAVCVLTDDAEMTPVVAGLPIVRTTDLHQTSSEIAERFYGHPGSRLRLIGVTGTNGKTTVTYLIHQILNALGVRCGLMGTVCVDDGTEVAPATLTTAPALEISRTLARMVDAGCRAAALEVSSHALHQRRVGALGFDAAVFTNLSGDHLDYHGTMDRYSEAKRMLFASVRTSRDTLGRERPGIAIVNADDTVSVAMESACPAGTRIVRCRVVKGASGGSEPSASTDARARVLGLSSAGTRVELSGPWGPSGAVLTRTVNLPLVGAFNAMNALQAVCTVLATFEAEAIPALSPEAVLGALEHVQPPPGRLEPVTDVAAPIRVFVDYAHTDDALRTTLSTVRDAMNAETSLHENVGSLICVFGCGGDRDRTKRPRMGRAVAELADQIVITSDNPRRESPDAIIDEVLSGIPAEFRDRVTVEPDRERAIRLAIRRAQSATEGSRRGDVVAICGKGHEDYQILPDPSRPGGTITRHFDDREVARAALLARGISVRSTGLTANTPGSKPVYDDLSLNESIEATEALFEPGKAGG